MKTIKTTITLLLLSISTICFGQKLGYGFFNPNVEYVFAGNKPNATPVIQYGMDMGVGKYLGNNFGVHVGFGAYRSAVSFNNINYDQKESKTHTESVAGPKVFVGADWFIQPEKIICPVVSLSIGYRFLISSFHDEPLYDNEGLKNGQYNNELVEKGKLDIRYIPIKDYSFWWDNIKSIQHGSDGLFIRLKAGTNIKIKEVAINISVSYELTQFYDGGFVGDKQERFNYYDEINGIPSYRPSSGNPWKTPFIEKFRNAVGFSISFVI